MPKPEEINDYESVNSVDEPDIYDFPNLTKTTGTLPGEYLIKLDTNAKGVVHPARRQPASVLPLIVDKLHEMESNGYIAKVEQPTNGFCLWLLH